MHGPLREWEPLCPSCVSKTPQKSYPFTGVLASSAKPPERYLRFDKGVNLMGLIVSHSTVQSDGDSYGTPHHW